MNVCPCRRYRQLNSILNLNNHIQILSKIIFNRLVLKNIFSTWGQFESRLTKVVLFSLQNSNTDSFIRSIYHIIGMINPKNVFFYEIHELVTKRATFKKINLKLLEKLHSNFAKRQILGYYFILKHFCKM